MFAAEYVKNALNKSKVAVLFVKSDWGSGIKNVFVESFEDLGGTVVLEEGYDQSSRDLRTQLTKIKAADPDILYFLGYTEASIPGITQARELGLTVPIFGGDPWGDNTIWEKAGAAGEGAMYSLVHSPLNEVFKAEMARRTGYEDVTVCAPHAYDAAHILADVIGQVGTDTTDIKDKLYSTVYRNGVSSEVISFDENGDQKFAEFVVMEIIDGKSVVVENSL